MEKVEAEIVLDSFKYERYFPNSKLVDRFQKHERQIEAIRAGTPLFNVFAELWFKENEIAWKYSYKVTLKNSLSKHILPVFGEMPVSLIKKV